MATAPTNAYTPPVAAKRSVMTVLRGDNDNEDRRDQDRRKIRQNAMVVVWVVALLTGAFWLVDAFVQNSREQECYARGGRTCNKLELPAATR